MTTAEAIRKITASAAELAHASAVFIIPEAELDKNHCAWCHRAWRANFKILTLRLCV